MHALYLLTGVLFILNSQFTGTAGKPTPPNVSGIQKYTRPHSIGRNYTFNPRDGWETVNVTNLQYKYQRVRENHKQKGSHKHRTGVGVALGALADVWAGLKGIGLFEDVKITWYSGGDLQNPSCWAKGNWAPTDESFACALTMKGWMDRPKCFEFIELCGDETTCVFVRVVDTCAGCNEGTKHVDLTKAPFKALAKSLDVGVTHVKMRRATRPKEWHLRLWGPPFP